MSQGSIKRTRVLLDTDGTFAANDDLRVPSQKATKTYSDNVIALTDATLPFTDNTGNNVSATKHGFVPKMANREEYGLRGDGTAQIIDPFAFRRASYHLVTPTGGTSASGRGFNTTMTGDAAVAVTTTTPQALQFNLTPTTNIGSTAGWTENAGGSSSPQFRYNRRLEAHFLILCAETGLTRLWCGLTNTTRANMAATDGTSTYAYAAFRWSFNNGVSGVNDAFFMACTSDGLGTGNNEALSTGVAKSTTVYQRLSIVWDGTGTNKVKFYIDGTLVKTSTIDMVASEQLYPFFHITTLGNGVARNIKFAGLWMRSEWPNY